MKKLTIILILFTLNCTSKNNYQEEFDMRVLLTIAAQSPPDPQAACINNMQSAESCLVNATAPPAAINETSLSLIVSSNIYNSYTNYCTGTLSSAYFSNSSALAKVCVMDCQKEYWNNKISAGTCNTDFTTQLSGLSQGSNACVTDCFQLLNN